MLKTKLTPAPSSKPLRRAVVPLLAGLTLAASACTEVIDVGLLEEPEDGGPEDGGSETLDAGLEVGVTFDAGIFVGDPPADDAGTEEPGDAGPSDAG